MPKYRAIAFISNTLKENFYRPQRSCEGYVFTGVCLSTWGGLPQCMLGYHTPLGADPPRSRPPWEQTPGADTPQSRHPPRADTPWSRHTPRADTPRRDGHCCGRYASYWNAFLYKWIVYCLTSK